MLRRQHDLKKCVTMVTVRHYPANITSCYKHFVVSIGQPHNIIIIILLHNAHVHLYGACVCVCVCACIQASINKTLQWPLTQSCLPSKAHLKNTVGDRTINSEECCTSHLGTCFPGIARIPLHNCSNVTTHSDSYRVPLRIEPGQHSTTTLLVSQHMMHAHAHTLKRAYSHTHIHTYVETRDGRY